MGYDDKTDCLCQKMDAAACHLGGLHLPFAGNFHRAQRGKEKPDACNK